MESALVCSFIFFFCVMTIEGMSTGVITTSKDHSSCGSWTPYTDAKCLCIADTATFQTKKEADAVCSTFAEAENLDNIPRLVTVKSDKEQQALERFLFEEVGILDHVWLGVERGDDGVLRWHNELELYFNNLAQQNITSADRQCVQMESGQGIYPKGQWVRVNCRKRNLVVCEKTQVWTTAKLQNNFLNFKSKVERHIDAIEVNAKMATPEKNTGSTFPVSRTSSVCGEWKPYKDQKCLKIATEVGHQTKEDAEMMCQALHQGNDRESHPRLMTVKTKGEQAFIQNFLFNENKIVDNVWLGLELKDELRWNDGTSVVYNNWAGQNATNDNHRCLQMSSGAEITEKGFWVWTSCKRANVVVCERTQTLTLELLQNMFLNYKLEQEELVNEKERKLKEEIDNLKRILRRFLK